MRAYSDPVGNAKVPIKLWLPDGVPIETSAMAQLYNVSTLPFIHKHIAVMPDVHWGMGATVGSVIPTRGAIVPAAVGVDIGCGMRAARTDMRLEDLGNLSSLRRAIEVAVPHGRTDNGGSGDKGAWGVTPKETDNAWTQLVDKHTQLVDKHPKLKQARTTTHLGTLGSGNHFIELCLNEDGAVWVMLHSGSRGIGNRIGSYFIEKARKEMERWWISLPDENLAFLPEHSPLFKDYLDALTWAQYFALCNRDVMMRRVMGAISVELSRTIVWGPPIDCFHNYTAREHHFGADVWLTRKGAIRARKGDMGIIPGSMGTRSYIVEGLGNPESFQSCSHGAGRVMSRNEARKRFSLEDHARATEGVECRKDDGVLDETPQAYKDIDAVMAAQLDLVTIKHTLKQVLCVKG